MLLITSQSAHALQLAEFRDHIGIGYTDDDPVLQRSLDAAVRFWERQTQYYIRDTTFTLDWWSPYAPVDVGGGSMSLSSVVRLHNDGSTTTTVTSDWFLNRQLGSYVVQLKSTGSFYNGNRYTGTFTLTADSIVPDVKAAIYGLGHHLFTYRSAAEEVAIYTVPFSVRAIIGLYQKGSM